MTQDLTVLQGSELNHAFGAIHTMRQRGIHHLPVVDADHRPLDLITVKALQQHLVPPPCAQTADGAFSGNTVPGVGVSKPTP